MSRFFAHEFDSDSDSSSDEEVPQRPAAAFMMSDDEEEDVKRVMRSAKEKRYEELSNQIKQIRNLKKIKDMSSILTIFGKLKQSYDKARSVIQKEENGLTPRFYVRCLVELEDFIAQVWEERSTLSKLNGKSLATLKQQVKKYTKFFEEDTVEFRKNPDLSDDEEVDNIKGEAETKVDSDFSDDDSDEFPLDSDSESSSEEENEYVNPRDRFLKRKTGNDEDKVKIKEERKKERKDRATSKKDEEDLEGGWEIVQGGGKVISHEKPKMFAQDAEINLGVVVKKLNEIMGVYGKKRSDRKEKIELLQELQSIANEHKLGDIVDVKIQFGIVLGIMDYNPNVSDVMKPEYWTKLLEKFHQVLDLLESHQNILMSLNITEDTENFDKAPYQIRGCILSTVERLDDEFNKLLKGCDSHSNEYLVRLRDLPKVSNAIQKVEKYLENRGSKSELCRIKLRNVQYIYWIKKEGEKLQSSLEEMERLCGYIYTNDKTNRLRTNAVLSHIYHHALHGNWYKARDLFLMSNLQATIHKSDIVTQCFYNRTMAQLGISAFRNCKIQETLDCLSELMVSGKLKELLAQGFLQHRQKERSIEQEKLEKQRQLPYHLHINLELLECVYLVSAMLIEVPYLVVNEFDSRRRMISKAFYHQLRNSERQTLVGPPETMREHVVVAAKALRNGDWNACNTFIVNDKMNAKVWNLFNHEADNVKVMLTRLIKEESLKIYLFTYSRIYDSISLPFLAEMFELDRTVVYKIIAKMILNADLLASFEGSETVIVHRSEPSRMQSLTLQLVDKIANLTESNERILENGERHRKDFRRN